MSYEYTWYFEIAKEAEMAHDEDGTPSECYSKISLGFEEQKSEEKIKQMEPAMRKHIADMAQVSIDFVISISKVKYEIETLEQITE
ncbi:hypothetical protein [Paenibacillus alba]|uniref:Uncharacterized protein n=1 Tax=Paenibacillus alba TaxID=1197127 RepID=A0ABU6GEW5_9BACL|nr:hypothetical protein [Paenibacillus alba]MEC0231298.1 hypothetical protein [Paenibacillus alba]